GFCVRPGNWADLELAIRCSCCLWGGRCNPIVVVDNLENAKSLIAAFCVDCLCGAQLETETDVEEFIKRFPHLSWPIFNKGIFAPSGVPNFLDISHTARKIYDEYLDRAEPIFSPVRLYNWQDDDPLRFMLLATFGGYPPEGVIKRDYRAFVKESLQAADIYVTPEHAI